MKRIIYILLIVSVLVLTVFIFIKPAVIFLAKRQLERVFAGSAVSIGDGDLKPLDLLTFSHIKINKPGAYDFRVKQISLRYSPFSVLKSVFSDAPLEDAVISVDVEADSLDSRGFRLESASLRINQIRDGGILHIRQLKYGKAEIRDIKSKARLKDKVLFLDSLSAEALGGQVQGDLNFKIGEKKEYIVNLKFINLDLEKLVNDFNLNKKVRMTGKLGGALAFKGSGLDINTLTGDFSAEEYGGILNIRDAKFLENLARRSKQPLDIIVESFKNYHYNTGVMRLSFDKGNLILDIALDGETGKRNLNIVLHDFGLRRGEL